MFLNTKCASNYFHTSCVPHGHQEGRCPISNTTWYTEVYDRVGVSFNVIFTSSELACAAGVTMWRYTGSEFQSTGASPHSNSAFVTTNCPAPTTTIYCLHLNIVTREALLRQDAGASASRTPVVHGRAQSTLLSQAHGQSGRKCKVRDSFSST